MLFDIIILFTGIAIGIFAHIVYEYVFMKQDGFIVITKGDTDFAAAGIEFYEGANDISKKKRIVLAVETHL